MPADPVKAIDTNGTGDRVAVAFLYASTHGYDFAEAALLANRAAGPVVPRFRPRLKPGQNQEVLQALTPA